ncbi:MAG TPA: pilus assembly protein TadG-related protein [Stellaceae bacterium]|nr:pilus assembly protein TadG-related protein [Stellaceae bacterium]
MLHIKSPLAGFVRRLADDQRGIAAVVTAIALVVLMGFCGLAVDVVMWEVNERAMQGAADQAALAAASAFRSTLQTTLNQTPLGQSQIAINAAYAAVERNGYPSSEVTVAAYNNGSTCTGNGCLKVTITQQQPRYFTAVFMSTGPTASASAVGSCSGCQNGAFNLTSNGGAACVMALDASGKGVVTTSGNPTMTLNACDLYNNSSDTNATIVSGGGVITGTQSRAFLAQPNVPSGQIQVPVTTNAAPVPDPYAGLTPPTVSAPCQQLPTPPTNVPSGTYCGGNHFQNQTVTFANNAVIVITGGLDLHSGSTSFTGTGVTVYVVSDGSNSQASTINATTTMNFAAPSSSQYAGIALWFSGGSPVSYAGTNGSGFKGAIYAPDADMSYSGSAGSTSTCTRLIAGSVSLTGGSNATFSNTGCPAIAGPVRTSSGVSGTTPYTGSPVLVQ